MPRSPEGRTAAPGQLPTVPQQRRRRRLHSAAAASVRRRPLAFAGLALLAVGAVLASSTPLMLLRSAQQASLAAAAPAGTTAMILRLQGGAPLSSSFGTGPLTPSSLWAAAAPALSSQQSYSWIPAGATHPLTGRLLAAADCRGVRITTGSCPTAPGQLAVSAAQAVGVGSRVSISSISSTPFTVVGKYAPGMRASPFTNAAVASALQQLDPHQGTTDLLISSTELADPIINSSATVVVTLVRPLHLEDLGFASAAIRAAMVRTAENLNGSATAPLHEVIRQQSRLGRAAQLIALTLAVQVLAVTWAAQAQLVSGIARNRAGEWGITRLRGFTRIRRITAILREPLLAIVLRGA